MAQSWFIGARLPVKADPKDKSDAARLRNWVFDKILSHPKSTRASRIFSRSST